MKLDVKNIAVELLLGERKVQIVFLQQMLQLFVFKDGSVNLKY